MKALKFPLFLIILTACVYTAEAQMEDDLYALPVSRQERAERAAQLEQAKAAQAQAKQDYYIKQAAAQKEQQRQQDLADRAQKAYYEKSLTEKPSEPKSILVENIDDALYRRMDAMNFVPSESTNLMEIQEQYARRLQRQYNPDLYNVIIINDKIWVEPKYITSLFAGTNDASNGVNDYMNRLKKSSTFSSSSIKAYYSDDYGYWNNGHYNNAPMGGSSMYGYSSWGSPYYNNSPWGWGYPQWGFNWGGNMGFYWGSSWGSPWYNPWYSPWNNPWYNPWNSPWNHPWSYYGSSYNRHPRVYGNTINGDNGIIRHNYPQSSRPGFNNNVNGNRTPAYDAGYGRGQNSYNQPTRPQTNSYPQPTRQTYEPTRPSAPASAPSTGGYGGGFQNNGGSRRR